MFYGDFACNILVYMSSFVLQTDFCLHCISDISNLREAPKTVCLVLYRYQGLLFRGRKRIRKASKRIFPFCFSFIFT